ncbi:LicD family protein [Enterococcus sp. AZ196]|uniref:LicD family protein n=1 Tax=Enterococcus sp. AZ196 TaxID=2774659 RepID=UPI003D2CE6A6
MEEESQLRRLQMLELEALIELRAFCQMHGMDFFLRGGSVMGAVKYSGFVPWDDDADIAIFRKDYDRFIELTAANEWSEKFEVVSYKYNPEIHCYFPRVLLKEAIRKKEGLPKNNHLGLSMIDILPIDGSPNSSILKTFYYTRIYVYRALAGVWTMGIEDTVSMHDSTKKKVLSFLKQIRIHRLYSQVSIYERLDRLYTKYPLEQSKDIGTITGSLYKKEILPREWWGNGEELAFENHRFLVPVNYNDYLKQLYGENYLTYTPSVTQQEEKKHIK